MRRCWTCNTEHDLDAACLSSMTVRSMQAASSRADFTSPDLFDDAADDGAFFGPVFTARFDGECDVCDGAIFAGQPIRAWSGAGYIHATSECEREARS